MIYYPTGPTRRTPRGGPPMRGGYQQGYQNGGGMPRARMQAQQQPAASRQRVNGARQAAPAPNRGQNSGNAPQTQRDQQNQSQNTQKPTLLGKLFNPKDPIGSVGKIVNILKIIG